MLFWLCMLTSQVLPSRLQPNSYSRLCVCECWYMHEQAKLKLKYCHRQTPLPTDLSTMETDHIYKRYTLCSAVYRTFPTLNKPIRMVWMKYRDWSSAKQYRTSPTLCHVNKHSQLGNMEVFRWYNWLQRSHVQITHHLARHTSGKICILFMDRDYECLS